uniref:Uncharacterized protein n=1 Tax=Melopsittacus undulatus TaxID=13146 RepID=A0A8V5GC93_MELUD
GSPLTPISSTSCPPPREELTSPHPTLTLTCLARGFHPASISVQWQREQRPLGRGQAAPQPIRERQGVTCYFLYTVGSRDPVRVYGRECA